MVPALAMLVIAILVILGIAMTAARVNSDKAVSPNAPASQPKAYVGDPTSQKKCGTNALYWYCPSNKLCGKTKGVCLSVPKPTTKPTYLAR